MIHFFDVSFFNPFFGALCALLSAASWAWGDILWSRIGEKLSATGMNIVKMLLGSVFLAIIIVLLGYFKPVSFHHAFFLAASGLLGIAVGDTLFFVSLKSLGPRLASLMGALIPVSIALCSFVFLKERLHLVTLAGIALTILGIVWVLNEQALEGSFIVKNKSLGIKCGGMAVVCTTIGFLLAKIGVESESTAQGALIRLVSGALGLLLWGMVRKEVGAWITPFRSRPLVKEVVFAVFVVVVGGFWLSLVALKYTSASVAGTLIATTPAFMLPLLVVLQKEKVSWRSCFGAVLVVAGVALIMAYQG